MQTTLNKKLNNSILYYTYRKETCLPQAPGQTILFIFRCITLSGENQSGQNKTIAI